MPRNWQGDPEAIMECLRTDTPVVTGPELPPDITGVRGSEREAADTQAIQEAAADERWMARIRAADLITQ